MKLLSIDIPETIGEEFTLRIALLDLINKSRYELRDINKNTEEYIITKLHIHNVDNIIMRLDAECESVMKNVRISRDKVL